MPISHAIKNPFELTASFADLESTDADTVYEIDAIHIANTTGTDRWASICIEDVTATGDVKTAICWQTVVKANDFITFGKGVKMGKNRFLTGRAELANALTVVVGGKKIS